jgi:mono/diheme cytochrome c family protein
MNRYIAILLSVLLAVPSPIFAGGRPCITCATPYRAPIKTAVARDKVIINNTLIGIPVPVPYNNLIAEQGTTAYGSSLSSFAYGTDLNVVFANADRFLRHSQELTQTAFAGTIALAQQVGANDAAVAKTIAEGQAVAGAFRALREAPRPGGQAVTFQVTVDANGQVQVNQNTVNAQAEIGANIAKPAVEAEPVSSLTVQHCGTCHTQGGEGFAKWALSDAITSDERLAGIRAVMKPAGEPGHMPKGSELDGETMAAIVAELSK